MTTQTTHSTGWIAFTYVSFAVALLAVSVGILLLPVGLAAQGYMAMGTAMLVQSCITLTKTLRDRHEGSKLTSRIENARAEELLARHGG